MKGLFAQLPCDRLQTLGKVNFGNLATPEQLDGAFAPFVMTARANAVRFGPSGFPMFGVGCFIIGLNDYHGIVQPLLPLRAAGLHEISDVDKTLDDRRFRTWRPISLKANREHIVWAPYGYLPFLTGGDEFNSHLIVPIMNATLATQSTEDIWTFISTQIISFANRHDNMSKSPWRTLIPALRTFNQQLFTGTT